jgi:hypothetical protein
MDCRYYFHCTDCGREQVSQELFEEYLPDTLNGAYFLKQQIDCVVFLLYFVDACRHCISGKGKETSYLEFRAWKVYESEALTGMEASR